MVQYALRFCHIFQGLVSLGFANSSYVLSLERLHPTMYWGLFNILISKLYLLFRRVILRSRTQTRFPVAISFFEDSVYFTDGILMAIKKTNAYASSNATVVALDNGVVSRQPLDIVVSHPLMQTKCKLFSYFFSHIFIYVASYNV